MKRRSSNVLAKDSVVPEIVPQAVNSNKDLEEKVVQLESALKQFRAEVEMKMSIVEQVLSTRNDQFIIQKKLLDREQALHETVLSHWKNVADLAANGLSLKFTDTELCTVKYDIEQAIDDASLKRKSSAGVSSNDHLTEPKGKKRRIRSKRKSFSGTDHEDNINPFPDDGQSSNDVTYDEMSFTSAYTEEKETNHENEEVATVEGQAEDEGMERRVFVNCYAEDGPKSGPNHTRTPIWKYFLREEDGGELALCKLCDEEGIQTILSVKRGCGTSTLHKHARSRHGIMVETMAAKRSVAAEREGRIHCSDQERGQGIVRTTEHKKFLFEGRWHCMDTRNPENGVESWRCARYWATRCRGRLRVKPDADPVLTNPHTCLPHSIATIKSDPLNTSNSNTDTQRSEEDE